MVVFGAPSYRDHTEPLMEIQRRFPKAIVVGCSTAGEIADTMVNDESLSVAISRFEKTQLRCAYADSSDSDSAGRALAEQLNAPDLKGVFVLSEGLSINGSELVCGLNAVLDPSVVVTGGLAGDGDRFASTWIMEAGKPVENRVCAVGFYGDAVMIGHGSKGGWDIFGPDRKVTRAENNVLFELDGQPALELYKTYLGEQAEGLPATGLLFPLAVRREDSSVPVVRTILSIDESQSSLTFAGDIPEGAQAQLMRANFDRLIDGAEEAALMTTKAQAEDRPVLSIAISCVGRRLVLGERTEEEVEATLEVLPENTNQIGFYSYGEISPLASGRCDLHNQTMTLTTIYER